MKATLLDVGLILLILVGTAGADGPAKLATALQATSTDSAQPVPKYTPIPASRKLPPNSDSSSAPAGPPAKLAQQVDFESLPLASDRPKSVVRSEFVPADSTTKTPARLAVAPNSNGVPGFEISLGPSSAGLSTAPVEAPPLAGAPTGGSVVLPAPPAAVQAPTTVVYSSSQPTYAYKPLAPVVATPRTIHLGRGIIGQPTVYVPGQPVRNFLRYFSP